MISSSPRLLAPLIRSVVAAAVPRHSSSLLLPSRAARSPPGHPLLFRRPRHCRTMASASAPPPGKFEFLVVVPDKPGAQAKRLEVRS